MAPRIAATAPAGFTFWRWLLGLIAAMGVWLVLTPRALAPRPWMRGLALAAPSLWLLVSALRVR